MMEDDCTDAGGRAPTVGALGDAWSNCREHGVLLVCWFPSWSLGTSKTARPFDHSVRLFFASDGNLELNPAHFFLRLALCIDPIESAD